MDKNELIDCDECGEPTPVKELRKYKSQMICPICMEEYKEYNKRKIKEEE